MGTSLGVYQRWSFDFFFSMNERGFMFFESFFSFDIMLTKEQNCAIKFLIRTRFDITFQKGVSFIKEIGKVLFQDTRTQFNFLCSYVHYFSCHFSPLKGRVRANSKKKKLSNATLIGVYELLRGEEVNPPTKGNFSLIGLWKWTNTDAKSSVFQHSTYPVRYLMIILWRWHFTVHSRSSL